MPALFPLAVRTILRPGREAMQLALQREQDVHQGSGAVYAVIDYSQPYTYRMNSSGTRGSDESDP